jgi:MPBQ/MSBQ methyltransferase
MNSELLDASASEVTSFYGHIRDYWGQLSSLEGHEPTRILNFGYWSDGAKNLYEAQIQFCELLLKRLPDCSTMSPKGLEIGCGIGGISHFMARNLHQLQMTGLDISEQQLAVASSSAALAGLSERIEWQVGSSMDMPLPSEHFDFSLCIESSFHYDRKATFFAENFRVLKSGGTAIVADITCSDVEKIKLRRGNHFERPEVYKQLIRDSGFELVEALSIGSAVYRPLYDAILRFNRTNRNPIGKYWAMVLRNYSELFDSRVMDYWVFVLRKK